jgi:serine/threonine protein kinase
MLLHLAEGAPGPQPADAVEVLAAQFLAQLQAGANPDRQVVVRAHPHLGDRLERRLAHVEMLYRVGLAPKEESTSDSQTTDAPAPAPDAKGERTVLAGEGAVTSGGRPGDPPNYEILAELGHGGMGVVYQARQKSLNRLVALKMIAAGAHASPQVLARFHLEAEALASLQHPHIVQVYEVGEHHGCPFMALEFVDGGTLDNHLAGRPQPPGDAAALVETLARAMHAAHQRGIVHRDLKPANILLQKLTTETPRHREDRKEEERAGPSPSFSSSRCLGVSVVSFIPKITDFGLAKRLAEDKAGTTTGTILGTPSYMSPEQAAGRVHEIGAPTDVYALGALLYEMLTGQPPFQGETVTAVLKRVESEEPAPPSRLCPKLPRDLETICLKCLEKPPAQRYATAEDLADDLRRFQGGEPITARPAGVGERAWKWVKRRPTLAALIGVSCAAVVALVLGGISWSLEVRAERDRARHSLQVARKAIDDLYTKMASERLFDEPQLDALCQELLDKARSLYEELAAQHSDQPEVRRDIALAWFRLGEIHRLLDQREPAQKAYREAIDRQEELRRDYPREPCYCQDLANSHNWLGELLREHNRLAEAERHYRAALALQQDLVEQFPKEPAYSRELARSLYNLGIVEKDTNRLAEARADAGRAVDLLTDVYQANPADPSVRQDLARALNNRGLLHWRDGRPEEAGRDYDQAIDLLARLRDQFRARAVYKFELAIVQQNRGNLLWSQGRHADAQREHQEALAVLRVLAADFSSRPSYKKKMASALINLGSAMASARDPAGAEKCWHQARGLLETLARDYPETAEHHGLLGMTLGLLGWLRTEQKDWSEARRLIEQGIVQMQAALKPNPQHPRFREELRNQYQDLAETLVQLGDHVAAVKAATNLAGVSPQEARDNYYAACFIARCVPLASKDEKTASLYVGQAVAFLQKAAGNASSSLKRLGEEKEVFQPLASHPAFGTVMRELEANMQRSAKR